MTEETNKENFNQAQQAQQSQPTKKEAASPLKKIKTPMELFGFNAFLLLAFFLAGILIGRVLTLQLSGLNLSKQIAGTNIFVKDGKTWVAYDEPIINAILLTDKGCSTCGNAEMEQNLKSVIPTVAVNIVDISEEQGKDLASRLEIKAVPAVIFGSEISKAKAFSRLSQALQNKDGQYILTSEILAQAFKIYGIKYLNPPKVSDTDAKKGPDDAKVTLIEFSDFECPFCARAEETIKQLLDQYKDKIKLVFKNLPLPMHKSAAKAAEAAECAGEQNKFWEMHDILFANQKDLTVDNYIKWAKELKLDAKKFEGCLDSEKYKSKIETQADEAQNLGIGGTPAFFINDRFIGGNYPLENFQKVIDEELSK